MKVQIYPSQVTSYNGRGPATTRTEYRWRIKARNGKTVAASSEGFAERRGARRNLATVFDTYDGNDATKVLIKGQWIPIETVDQ